MEKYVGNLSTGTFVVHRQLAITTYFGLWPSTGTLQGTINKVTCKTILKTQQGIPGTSTQLLAT